MINIKTQIKYNNFQCQVFTICTACPCPTTASSIFTQTGSTTVLSWWGSSWTTTRSSPCPPPCSPSPDTWRSSTSQRISSPHCRLSKVILRNFLRGFLLAFFTRWKMSKIKFVLEYPGLAVYFRLNFSSKQSQSIRIWSCLNFTSGHCSRLQILIFHPNFLGSNNRMTFKTQTFIIWHVQCLKVSFNWSLCPLDPTTYNPWTCLPWQMYQIFYSSTSPKTTSKGNFMVISSEN